MLITRTINLSFFIFRVDFLFFPTPEKNKISKCYQLSVLYIYEKQKYRQFTNIYQYFSYELLLATYIFFPLSIKWDIECWRTVGLIIVSIYYVCVTHFFFQFSWSYFVCRHNTFPFSFLETFRSRERKVLFFSCKP